MLWAVLSIAMLVCAACLPKGKQRGMKRCSAFEVCPLCAWPRRSTGSPPSAASSAPSGSPATSALGQPHADGLVASTSALSSPEASPLRSPEAGSGPISPASPGMDAEALFGSPEAAAAPSPQQAAAASPLASPAPATADAARASPAAAAPMPASSRRVLLPVGLQCVGQPLRMLLACTSPRAIAVWLGGVSYICPTYPL